MASCLRVPCLMKNARVVSGFRRALLFASAQPSPQLLHWQVLVLTRGVWEVL